MGVILDRLLRPYIKSDWVRCAGVLLLLLTEQLLFLVNNYMVDLLALPLLLEATRLALGSSEPRNTSRETVRLAVFLGASVAFKLTNLAFAVPILLVYSYRTMKGATRQQLLKNSRF